MKRISLFTFVLLMAAGLYAQVPKISTRPGCKNYRVGEKHLPNVPACRKTFHTPPLALSSVISGGVVISTDNVVDSFYLNDSKGFLLACATHNPVSYTHLDVYKRQVQVGIDLDGFLFHVAYFTTFLPSLSSLFLQGLNDGKGQGSRR